MKSLELMKDIWTRFCQTWQSVGMGGIASIIWSRFWMQFAGLSFLGRIATWLATWFAPPYKERRRLARYNSKGYIAPSATIHHPQLQLGAHIFIGDRVVIFRDKNGGPVELAKRVYLHNDTCIQTGDGGSLKIGSDTHIQPHCQFSAYKASIQIGCDVQIAPNCAFYPYAHGTALGKHINKQPLQSKGGIIVKDDAWLGYGVIVLDGVTIGKGAVVGAGAVVTQDIPDNVIAVGVPARVVASRKFSEALFTQNKKSNCEEGRQLPNLLSAALAEVKETAELIYDEVEEAIAEQLHYYVAPTDMVPTDLFLQTLLHQLLSCTRQVMNVDTVAVLLKTEDGQQLAVRATIGLEEEITEEIRIPIGQGFAGRIAASREVTIVDDLSKVEVVSPILRDKGLQSMLGVPLLVKDRVIGVFHVGTIPPHQFTEEDAQLLKLVADHVGLVTERLAISRQSLINDSVLIRREKFGLINSLQETRRTIGNLGGNLLPKALLELAPPRWLVSTSC